MGDSKTFPRRHAAFAVFKWRPIPTAKVGGAGTCLPLDGGTMAGDICMGFHELLLDADCNSGLRAAADDDVRLQTAGVDRVTVTDSLVTITLPAVISSVVIPNGQALILDDDLDTKIEGTAVDDHIVMEVGGAVTMHLEESKVGLYAETPVVQGAHIPDAGGTLPQATAAINLILVALENLGVVASA